MTNLSPVPYIGHPRSKAADQAGEIPVWTSLCHLSGLPATLQASFCRHESFDLISWCLVSPFPLVCLTASHCYRGTPPRSRSQGEHWQEFPTAQALQVCFPFIFIFVSGQNKGDWISYLVHCFKLTGAQVPFGAVQFSTSLPPNYQPPIYCSAPGKCVVYK